MQVCFMFRFANMIICLKEYNIIFSGIMIQCHFLLLREKKENSEAVFKETYSIIFQIHYTESKAKVLIRVTIAKYMLNNGVSVVAKNKNVIEIFLSKETEKVETVQKIIIWATISTNVFFPVPV